MPQLQAPGFLDLPPELSSWDSARFAVLPMPFDGTCSYGVGTRFGPAACIAASHQVEWYDDELGIEACEAGIATLRAAEPAAGGPVQQIQAFEAQAAAVVAEGKTLVGLGGEHSVSYASYRALAQRWPGLSVLQIDAHLDLRPSYQGTVASHASVMRRVHDAGATTVQVGVRSGSVEEWELVADRGLAVFRAQDIVPRPASVWIPQVLAALPPGPLFITVDLDGFDPSVIPGTGTPEPGGLGWWQGLALLRAVCAARPVVGLDVVELEPQAGSRISDFAAARLVYKLMGYVLQGAAPQVPRGS
jgi:agmatinase